MTWRVAHRLVVRAHHAERHVAAAVAHRQRRDDGVHRALAGRDRVRMIRLDHEARAAIVQHDAGLLGADAGAECAVERVDERHRGAVAVDHREIDRVAAGRRRLRQRHALVGIEQAAELLREALVEQARDRLAHDRPDRRCACRASRTRAARPRARDAAAPAPIGSSFAEIELLEDVQQHQRGQPLPVRRQFDHVEPAIVRADRRDDFALVARQILGREQSALGLHGRRDIGRDRRLDRTPSRRRPRSPSGSRRAPGSAPRSPIAGALAVRQIVFRRARMRLELVDLRRPVGADARRDRKAILGVADRGLQARGRDRSGHAPSGSLPRLRSRPAP